MCIPARCSFAVLVPALLAGLLFRPATAQIPEVPAPINDIAMASLDQYGNPVIYYNPTVVQRVGPVVASFFEAHEYAHHVLGHVRAGLVLDPYTRIQFQRQAEVEADRFAIDHWIRRNPRVLIATVQFFENPYSGNLGDLTHLPTAMRAQMIRQALGRVGVGGWN